VDNTEDAKVAEQYGIKLSKLYRRGHPDTNEILGDLSDSAIDRGIKDGSIPAPVLLTARGRASGWYGWQLAVMVRKREEAGQEHVTRLRDSNRQKHKGGRPRKTGAR
jgi:hypothetical protein